MYLMNTRPNICFAVNTLSQYLVKSRHVHVVAAKHVMRYLKGMIEFGLYYDEDNDYRLYDYTDADGKEVPNRERAPQVDFIL